MIDTGVQPSDAALREGIDALWSASGPRIARLCAERGVDDPTPVFTVRGTYQARGWTEWTEGFLYGWAILHFDATDDTEFLELGRRLTVERMARHLTHTGVHDHGFNNVSTYGNLRRLMLEGRIDHDPWEMAYYENALKVTGAVQASRWTDLGDQRGFIHSFNGPHSLFSDTIRSVRALSLSHQLGHLLLAENDAEISLLGRGVQHAESTAEWNVYFGKGRDIYDVRGRVVHESIFNVVDGAYRCPSTQQGYTPFTTWTRGLAWIMLGYTEQLEWLRSLDDAELNGVGGRAALDEMYLSVARATCDYYIESTPTDGIPYWDTGAPGLVHLPEHASEPADPFNPYEPVDSSAAAIAAQALLRLSELVALDDPEAAVRYRTAGLVATQTLLSRRYLNQQDNHQGLLLHGVYHRPNGWDYAPDSDGVPRGESVVWGDYHLMELGVYVQRMLDNGPYLTFYGGTA